MHRRRSGRARAFELPAYGGRPRGGAKRHHGTAMILMLVLALGESVDLPALSSVAFARSTRVQAARARAEGNAATVALEQPSPFPSLRTGARVWPAGSDSFPDSASQTRYRIYAQLR